MDVSQIPPRTYKDNYLDSHGRKLLDLCKSTSFVVANGRLGDDYNIGDVTYCSTKGVSTVDYLLVPITELSLIHTFQVLPFNEFSDHAPLFFSFASLGSNIDSLINETDSTTDEKIFWNTVNETLFVEKLKEKHDLFTTIENSDASINDKVENFSMLLAESEYHFLLVCPAYKELRRKYFPGYYNHWPTITKFDTLMSSESRKVIFKVAYYLYHAGKLRKLLLG